MSLFLIPLDEVWSVVSLTDRNSRQWAQTPDMLVLLSGSGTTFFLSFFLVLSFLLSFSLSFLPSSENTPTTSKMFPHRRDMLFNYGNNCLKVSFFVRVTYCNTVTNAVIHGSYTCICCAVGGS